VDTDLVRNGGNPRTKGSFGTSWSHQNWQASVNERFISDYRVSTAYTIDGQPWVMGEYWVTNANVSYRFTKGRLKGVRVRIGANNVFDEAPPFNPLSTAGYDSDYTDPRGRMTYIDLNYKF
jgi:iron complex outermembrane receptor protein